LYFTNLISARPLVGPAGAGSLAQVINGAIGNGARFRQMKAFFGEAGTGFAAGVWQDVPRDDERFRTRYAKQLERQRRAHEEVG
jgi:chlorophyllide a reductase subunit Y